MILKGIDEITENEAADETTKAERYRVAGCLEGRCFLKMSFHPQCGSTDCYKSPTAKQCKEKRGKNHGFGEAKNEV